MCLLRIELFQCLIVVLRNLKFCVPILIAAICSCTHEDNGLFVDSFEYDFGDEHGSGDENTAELELIPV